MSMFLAWLTAWHRSRPACTCSGWPHHPACARHRRNRKCRYCGRPVRRKGLLRAWKAAGRQGFACTTSPRLVHEP